MRRDTGARLLAAWDELQRVITEVRAEQEQPDQEKDELPPWAAFRFQTAELEPWFDGRKRTLTPGVDIPADATFEQVKRRLVQAAAKRRGRARVWLQPDGSIGFVLTPASWT